ncbi:MAG: type I pullulanase, partial [Turicibacter sp.]
MRKLQTFEAYLDTFETITAYLNKSYYQGESQSFRLKDETSTTTLLNILETVDEGEYMKYILETPILELGKNYKVIDDHNLAVPLQYGYVVRTKEFDEAFYYDGHDLGVTYTKEASTFKVWSPIATQVKVEVQTKDGIETYDLTKGDKGVWSITISQDLELASYIYLVKVNGTWNQATDPYAIASTPNHQRTVIVDSEK